MRFLAVALHTVESSLGKITPSMDDAARSLGLGQGETMRRVHVPMLRGSPLTAGLLVFVDVMKVAGHPGHAPFISGYPGHPGLHWLPMNGWRSLDGIAGHRGGRAVAADRAVAPGVCGASA